MRKNIKKICILGILLTFVSAIVIVVMGKTYTLKFQVKDGAEQLKFDNISGAVDIVQQSKVGNEYIVKIRGKKEGTVFFYVENGDASIQKLLYVHKSKIITDNSFFGYSNGSKIIPISLLIFLTYLLFLLIKQYRKTMKENIFQYKNVSYLGIIIFISFFAFNDILSIINYQGILGTINKIIDSISFFSIVFFPLVFITFCLVIINSIILLKREGKSFKNSLGLFLGVFICLLTLLPEFTYRFLHQYNSINIYNLNSLGPYLYSFVETVVYLIVSYLECVLLSTIIISLKAVRKKVEYDKDYIVILGCKISNDGELLPLIRGRVDCAIDFRNKQLKETGKDVIFIPSGGKGDDENISEAEAMKNYLIENGIRKENILVEDKSKNTYQNIKFSNNLINNRSAKVCFCTTNYHVFRAGLISNSLGLKMDGIGSKTKLYFWINAFIREFIGTIYSEKKKHIVVFILILVVMITMIYITYLSNNL